MESKCDASNSVHDRNADVETDQRLTLTDAINARDRLLMSGDFPALLKHKLAAQIYSYLVDHAWTGQKTYTYGQVYFEWLGVDTIAKVTQASVRGVKQALAFLEDEKLISRTARYHAEDVGGRDDDLVEIDMTVLARYLPAEITYDEDGGLGALSAPSNKGSGSRTTLVGQNRTRVSPLMICQ